MNNLYKNYYTEQAGSGLAGFQGVVRHQRGHGFFGRLLSKAVYPLMRFLGKKAVSTGANIASDVMMKNKNIKEAALERLKESANEIVDSGTDRAKKFIREGKGRKRKKSIKKNKISMNKNNKKRKYENFVQI